MNPAPLQTGTSQVKSQSMDFLALELDPVKEDLMDTANIKLKPSIDAMNSDQVRVGLINGGQSLAVLCFLIETTTLNIHVHLVSHLHLLVNTFKRLGTIHKRKYYHTCKLIKDFSLTKPVLGINCLSFVCA